MFAELLAKTCFSFLEGGSQPKEMIQRASELGLSAIGIADREGLYGIARAYDAGKKLEKAGLFAPKLLVGAELSLLDRKGRLSFLVESWEGYSNLCQLVTLAHRDLPKGESSLPFDAITGRTKGLWAMLPSPYDDTLAADVRELFGDHARLVVHRHLVADDRIREREARFLAKSLGLRIVASARPLYHDPSRRKLTDVLACIRMGVTIDEAGARIAPNSEAYLRGETEMRRLYRDAPALVEETGEIADACTFSMKELRKRYRFPCELSSQDETSNGALARLVKEHVPWRYPDGMPETVARQIDKELTLIEKLDVAPHFLSVHEIVQIARERGILCQGRGSAANSAVCYVLGITSVDPARANLLFERFLSAERDEPPDIDVDFEHERREEVIQEIYARYGRHRAAMVSEVISYRGKSALREVGKVFGLSEDQTAAMSSLSVWGDIGPTKERVRDIGLDPESPRVRQVLELAEQINGFPRHLSVHSGGFVLCAEALTDVAPVEPARMEGRTVVQWDKDDIDTLGFFKVDVLALGMLTAIRKSMEMLHAHAGTKSEIFDAIGALASLPPEDPAVYESFGRADTVGVFQIESRAQQAMLPKLLPKRFYDLVIEVAIVRPGPIQGGMVHPYLRRRSKVDPVIYPHPSLKPILERTLGVPLFQEQVMQLAITGAGYTGGEADELRRDMAAWRKDGMLERHRGKLLDGFSKIGISAEFSEALYKQIQGFGEYGFPESHAASFALLVYASGYLKVHHPAAFACALLNSQPMGFYSPSAIVQDAQRHGVEVRAIDVMVSEWDNALAWEDSKSKVSMGKAQPAIRLGMRQLRGFAEKTAKAIEIARSIRPFSDVDDLVRRARVNKREMEILAEAGALEALVKGRREALWRARAPRVEGLFERIPLAERRPALPRLSDLQQLSLDYEHTGLSVGDHPMRHLRKRLPGQVLTAHSLLSTKHKSKIAVAGIVQSRQRPGTASGVVFMTLEDETGTCNVILWSKLFEENRFVAVSSKMLMVNGILERDGIVVHVIAEKLTRLDGGETTVRTSSRDFH